MTEATIIIVLFIGFAIWALRGKSTFDPPKTSRASDSVLRSFETVPSVFVNRAEQSFFDVLSAYLPSGFVLLTKVRMEDIVRVKRAIKDQKQIWHLRARVKSRHVDFLITDRTGKPLIVIELDGSVHLSAEAQNADALKDGVFMQCGLKFKRVSVGEDFHMFAKRLCDYLTRLNLAA